MNPFTPGDIVRLKSGGFDMTVVAPMNFPAFGDTGPCYLCAWGNQFGMMPTQILPAACLELIRETCNAPEH